MNTTTTMAETITVDTQTTPTDEELKARLFNMQVKEIVELQERIKHMQERVDILKTQIAQTHTQPGKYQTEYGTVTVRKGSTRLDAKAFAKAYPPADYPGAYETKPIAASKLIKLFGTENLDGMLMQSAPTIAIA